MSAWWEGPWKISIDPDDKMTAMIWTLPPPKTEFEKGRADGLDRAADICEEYAKATMNPERSRGADILAKDIRREAESNNKSET